MLQDELEIEATLWLSYTKFKSSVIKGLSENGDFEDYVLTEDELDIYSEQVSEWLERYPIPFELVNACSYSCPLYIVALKDSVTYAWRGHPQKVNQSKLDINKVTQKIKQYEKFIVDLGITDKPCWFISSLYGV